MTAGAAIDTDRLARLGRALAEAGFDEAAVTELVAAAPSREAARVAVGRRGGSDPRCPLVMLFVFGGDVAAGDLPVHADLLVAAGLARRDGDLVRPLVGLTPWAGGLVAHDLIRDRVAPDHVPGPYASSQSLASLTVRGRGERVLDLGTGSGAQVVSALPHAEHVVATDVNPRAVRFASVSAALSGGRVDARRGSWFEPVGDERFDLVVANPPFVIGPGTEAVFRDSGPDGEDVGRRVVRGAARHLADGAFATVLCNWALPADGPAWAPVEEWVEGTGCDALVLARPPYEPLVYASGFALAPRHDPGYAGEIERWLDHLAARDIAAIVVGAVVLRRRDGANWFRGIPVAEAPRGDAGAHLRRLFAATDAPLDDGAMMRARVRPVPGHRIDQRLTFSDRYALGTPILALDDSAGLVGSVDPQALPLLLALDGTRTVGEIVGETGTTAGEVLPTLRRLPALGLLEAGAARRETATPNP